MQTKIPPQLQEGYNDLIAAIVEYKQRNRVNNTKNKPQKRI